MIRVEKLKKVYNAKKGAPCVALDGVSFVLPSKGMVFIVGKSGSGKSTLLNLFGGLDGVTEGDIIIGGKKFSEFTESDYDDYRNSFVGFVFQDFCLIEGMTVFENVKLSLDLLGSSTDDGVRAALRTVDLHDFENRYPKELSGGQKQRVALARALVKNPRLILADEPTGNLDQRTAKQVLDSLKELSEDRLVVIVSHNAEDADKYADRIIELADGRVIRDVSRQEAPELPLIEDNKINLPFKRILTEEEIRDINSAVKNGDVEITQIADKFIKTESVLAEEQVDFRSGKRKISFKNHARLSSKLSKGNRIHGIFTVFMVSVLIILLSACRVFAAFDGKALIHEGVMKDTSYSFTLYKGYRTGMEGTSLKTDRLVEINDSDIQSFYNAGYEGNIYKLYNVSLALEQHDWNTLELGEHISYSGENSPYINLASGVLECDKSFLDGIYGVDNGEIRVLAGDIDEATPRAVIITDYFADCILNRRTKLTSYQQIVDSEAIGYTKFDVKAIIYTGYTERYADLLDEYKRIIGIKNKSERDEEIERLKTNESCINFYSEVQDYLSLGYYFGNDYEAQDEALVQSRGGTSLDNPYITIGGETFAGKQWAYAPVGPVTDKESGLAPGEIRISLMLYNSFMGTELTNEELKDSFTPFNITIAEYPYHTTECEPVYKKTFTVTGISYGPILLSYSDYLDIYKTHLYSHGLYFDNTESAASVYMDMENCNFFLGDEYYKTIYKIMDIVSIFEDFFLLLYVGLIGVCALLLISFARRSVKRRMYEIGVLRAIGCNNRTVAGLFTVNTVVTMAFITVLSIAGVRVLDPIMNEVLVENLAVVLSTSPIIKLKILKFNFISAIVDILTILLLGLLASFGVFTSCKKIKPINIIRNRE